MQGLVLIDKPSDWTSFDVVNYIRKIVATTESKKPKNVKVGHTGTLDPFATGLLVLLIGKEYTKRAEELTKLDKTYETTMLLGQASTTGDPEGDLTPSKQQMVIDMPSITDIKNVFATFLGQIEQIPPIYSAIKVNGQRAYKLAREGKEVVIAPRQVFINALELGSYSYPSVTFSVDVSSGTYIRALVEDIASKLGTTAYTSELRRTRVGPYTLADAISLDDLSAEILEQRLILNIL